MNRLNKKALHSKFMTISQFEIRIRARIKSTLLEPLKDFYNINMLRTLNNNKYSPHPSTQTMFGRTWTLSVKIHKLKNILIHGLLITNNIPNIWAVYNYSLPYCLLECGKNTYHLKTKSKFKINISCIISF